MSFKRQCGLGIIEVRFANANGNPDAEGGPRQMSDLIGLISDVSIKAKIRAIFADHESEVFKALQERFKFDPERFHVLESIKRGTSYHPGDYTGDEAVRAKNEAKKLADENPAAMCEKFVDVRLFGAGALFEDKSGDGDKVRYLKTGCVTITPAISINQVNVVEQTITKKACFRDENLSNLQGDIAPLAKKFVQHALYTTRICVNSHIAAATNTSAEDIEVLKVVLPLIFAYNPSASRPIGSVNMLHVYWKAHSNPLGSFNELAFWDAYTPKSKIGISPSTSLDDYTFPVEDGVEDLVK
ncbi:MAG: type I CRISPR-associated protein Cas7 [Proteobacteria bacterium]|nr:type I CRISPR-associated protein Cas7 [Pseudomonadota bacterium]